MDMAAIDIQEEAASKKNINHAQNNFNKQKLKASCVNKVKPPAYK